MKIRSNAGAMESGKRVVKSENRSGDPPDRWHAVAKDRDPIREQAAVLRVLSMHVGHMKVEPSDADQAADAAKHERAPRSDK